MTALSLEQHAADAKASIQAIPVKEWRQLLNWLIVWIGLANIAFMALWVVGAPPRVLPVVIAGVTGLLMRRLPFWVQFTAFLATLTFSILSFIAGVFNLNVISLIYSIRFMIELKPTQSIEYVFAAALVLAMGVAAWFALRRDTNFTDWRMIALAAIATLTLANLDAWMNEGMRGHYKRSPVAGAPFESAMSASNAEANAIASGRNLAIIMVESMGVPVQNRDMQRLLFSGFDHPAIRARYTSSQGTSLYYNSTTAGEVRELCDRWGDYYAIVDKGGDSSCLPARMKKAGYQTHAMHSFDGFFFDREKWYPGIGFDNSEFSDDLRAKGAGECGGVFPGACDRDIPSQLAAQLKSTDEPQLVYWLTVNSHLPVPVASNLRVEDCARFSSELNEQLPMICRQFYLWDQIEKAMVAEIAKSDFPPTDFLIVGDHMPPYYDWRHRSEWAPDRVPYLYLRWRDDFNAEAPGE